MSSKIVFDATEHPVHSVTLFQGDKADVNRRIQVDLKEGQNEVQIKNLPAGIVPSSIRVDSIGKAVIFDVVFRAAPTYDLLDPPAELVELRRKKEELKRRISNLEAQNVVLKGYTYATKPENTTTAQFSELLDLFATRGLSIADSTVDLNEELKKVESDVDSAEWRHKEDQKKLKKARITVVVLAEADGPAELSLSYAVSDASWTPHYDIRATIRNGEKETTHVELHYRASIKQSTTEDWKNVHLTLSTASQRPGGEIPELSLERLYLPDEGGSSFSSFSSKLHKSRRPDQHKFRSIFPIEGLSTVLSSTDSDVTIAVLDLNDVSLNWIAVPKEVDTVFLRCNVKNTTDYTFLPGNTKVFLDGNFVSTSALANVNPEELFTTSLGIDPSVRITFQQPTQKVHTTSGGGGLLGTSNKSLITTTTLTQRTTIKNSRLNPIDALLIKDQFPICSESKVKINPIQPALPDLGGPASMKEVEVLTGDSASTKSSKSAKSDSSVKARWKPANEDASPVVANDRGLFEWLVRVGPSSDLELQTIWEVVAPKGVKWSY